MTSFLLLLSIIKSLMPFLKLCLVCDGIELFVAVPDSTASYCIGCYISVFIREIVLLVCCFEYMVGL